jgi:hypothetical protein
MNLAGANTADMDAMLQRCQISKAALKQWQHAAWMARRDEELADRELEATPAADSNSSWHPSSASSQDNSQLSIKGARFAPRAANEPPK